MAGTYREDGPAGRSLVERRPSRATRLVWASDQETNRSKPSNSTVAVRDPVYPPLRRLQASTESFSSERNLSGSPVTARR